MELENLVCPSCGSTSITLSTKEYGICDHCGGRVTIPVKEEKIVINNIQTIAVDKGPDESNFVIETTYDDIEFKRVALFKLRDFLRTPVDVYTKSTFDQVNKTYEHYSRIFADTTLNYSVEIGTDHQESYTSRDSQGNSVTNYRTVTTWMPLSAVYPSNNVDLVFNAEFATDEGNLDRFVKELNRDNLKTIELSAAKEQVEDPKPMTPELEASAKKVFENEAIDKCKKQLPGQHYRNFTAMAQVKITKIEHIVAPVYNQIYSYGGKKSRVWGYAGHKWSYCDGFPDVLYELKQQISERSKTIRLLRNIFVPVGIVIAIAALVFSSFIPIEVGFILPDVVVLILVALGAISIAAPLIIHHVIKNNVLADVVSKHQLAKNKELGHALSKFGLTPLTEKENSEFQLHHSPDFKKDVLSNYKFFFE
jgi:ribosomal protein L37AE/L43A